MNPVPMFSQFAASAARALIVAKDWTGAAPRFYCCRVGIFGSELSMTQSARLQGRAAAK